MSKKETPLNELTTEFNNAVKVNRTTVNESDYVDVEEHIAGYLHKNSVDKVYEKHLNKIFHPINSSISEKN